MIGQPHNSPSIPPKVLWPVLIVVILGIAVGGFFLLNSYIYNEKQGDGADTVVATDKVDEDSNSEASVDVISGDGEWETYTNQELGIQFSYPIELGKVNEELLRTDDIGTLFRLTFGDDRLFAIYGNSSDASPQRTEHFWDLRGYTQDDAGVYRLNGFDTTVTPTETLSVNGREVLIVKSDDFSGAWTGSEGVGEISYLPPPDTGIGALMNAEGEISGYNFLVRDLSLVSADLFKQILSTFKFTTNTVVLDTSDWQTFYNVAFGYSFKYPVDKKLFGNFFTHSPEQDTEVYVGTNDMGTTDLYIHVITPDNYVEEVEREFQKPLAEYAQYVWLLNSEGDSRDTGGKEVSELISTKVGEYSAYTFSSTVSLRSSKGSALSLPVKSQIVMLDDGENKLLAVMPETSEYGLEILNTIKLSLRADTGSWPTYQNHEYGYTIQYPTDWLVSTSEYVQGKTNIKGPSVGDGWFNTPSVSIELKDDYYPDDECLIKNATVVVDKTLLRQQEEGCSYAGSTVATFFPYADKYIVVSWTTDVGSSFVFYQQMLESFRLL